MTVLCGYIVEKQREWQGEEIPQELVYVSERGEREDGEGEEKEEEDEEEEDEKGRRGGSATGEEKGYTEEKIPEICFNLKGLLLKYNLTTSGSPRIRA